MKQKCLAYAHGVFHLSESSSLQQVPHSYLKKFVHNRPLGMIRKQIKSRHHKLPELEIQINLKKNLKYVVKLYLSSVTTCMAYILSPSVCSNTQRNTMLRKEILEELRSSDIRQFKPAVNPLEEV